MTPQQILHHLTNRRGSSDAQGFQREADIDAIVGRLAHSDRQLANARSIADNDLQQSGQRIDKHNLANVMADVGQAKKELRRRVTSHDGWRSVSR